MRTICDEYEEYKKFMLQYSANSRERIFLAGVVEAYWEVSENFGRPTEQIKAMCTDKEILNKIIDSVQRLDVENCMESEEN